MGVLSRRFVSYEVGVFGKTAPGTPLFVLVIVCCHYIFFANMAQRRQKFNEENIDALIRAFELGANDKEACDAIAITPSCLYQWMRKYPDLKERCEEAKKKSLADSSTQALSTLEECKDLAESYVLRLLKGQVFKTKTRKDGSGAVIWEETEQVHPSDRILERFLPKPEGDDFTFNVTFGSAEEGL